MKLDVPDISPIEAKQAMETAKKIFAAYGVTQHDQDILYNAIMTMGISSMLNTRKSELLRQLGIKADNENS